MSQDSIAIAERRQQIENYQRNGDNYVDPGALTVKSLGRLANKAPDVATMLAEGIEDESLRINTLVAVAVETKEAGPIYDAYAIAQSDNAIGDPKKRSAKLGYIARHAARVDHSLALDIARSIESPHTRVSNLLRLTHFGDSAETELLQEIAVNLTGAGASQDGSFYWQYLNRTSSSGNYRLGLEVCKRRIKYHGDISNYPREEDAKKHRYVAECVVDAFRSSRRDYRDLAPIAQEVVELFAWCAQEGFTSSTRYRTAPLPNELKGHYYNVQNFHLITEGLKIAESFAQTDDVRSSRALLRTLKKLIDNSIKSPLPERLWFLDN